MVNGITYVYEIFFPKTRPRNLKFTINKISQGKIIYLGYCIYLQNDNLKMLPQKKPQIYSGLF